MSGLGKLVSRLGAMTATSQRLYQHYRENPPTGRGYRLAEWYWQGRRGAQQRPAPGTLCEAAYLAGAALRRERRQ